jgi:hypothetical protein
MKLFFLLCILIASVKASKCLKFLLDASQDCKNKNIKYVSKGIGRGNGLGSDFSFVYIYVHLLSSWENKRVVFVNDNETKYFKYDCASQHGWSCYFNLQCPDSYINLYSNETNEAINQHSEGLQWVLPNSLSLESLHERILEGYRKILLEKTGKSLTLPTDCDIAKYNKGQIVSYLTNYLYKLTPQVGNMVEEFKKLHHFDNLKDYDAMHWRLTDKIGEMNPAVWIRHSDPKNIADVILTFYKEQNQNARTLFISTDDCKAFQKLVSYFPSTIDVHSFCYDENDWVRKDNNLNSTIRLFTEIDILKNSKQLFGSIESTLLRLIYRLRYDQRKHYQEFNPEELLKNHHINADVKYASIDEFFDDLNY